MERARAQRAGVAAEKYRATDSAEQQREIAAVEARRAALQAEQPLAQ
jgi:hypothetical protein